MNMLKGAWWAVFVIALAVYGWMVLVTLAGIQAEAGGLRPFDMRPMGYSVEEARAFLAALSDAGREIYLGPQRLLDSIYPALLAIVLGGAAWMLFSKTWVRATLIFTALVGMLADYTENVAIGFLLDFPGGDAPDGMIEAASRATVVKSTLTGIVMVVVLIGLFRFLRNRRGA